MRSVFFVLAMLATSSNAMAETVACNPNGAVVTREDGTVFYLGKSCDAAIKGGGTGHWFNAASFLAVIIGPDRENSQGYQIFAEIPCLAFCLAPEDF